MAIVDGYKREGSAKSPYSYLKEFALIDEEGAPADRDEREKRRLFEHPKIDLIDEVEE